MLRPVNQDKQNEEGNSLSNWLNQIQRDSWQLELIISGVVIFLLLAVYEPLEAIGREYMLQQLAHSHLVDSIVMIALSFLMIALVLVTLGFIIHLIIRGFWIGAIGLRSVSGDFDYEALRYTERYEGWLRRRMGSFDTFIEKLEVRSSIAFSLAFLLFFALVSTALYSVFAIGVTAILVSLSILVEDITVLKYVTRVLIIAFAFVLNLSSFIYMVDFFTLGALKRSRRLGKIYFPIYRVMGFITMASLYRPFYYNLIDHPFGRRLARMLFPLLLVSILVTGITFGRSVYLPANDATIHNVKSNSYLTTEDPDDIARLSPSLATYYPETDYLEVFFPTIGHEVNRTLKEQYPDLRTASKRSIGFADLLDTYDEEVPVDTLLHAHRMIHHVYLNDSLLADAPWKFYRHPIRKQPGLVYALPIYDLPRGEHCLRFERLQYVKRDSLSWEDQGTLCFVR
ncbi:hypothetical protein [Lewinella sp. 4G2]|uniref:hypothetical protein n=1 Tax=Lewinella sp. 4G2 TaxID=1803372 RepID=UPI0007B4F3FA|nr:hypothetical protein [Lewinella sp. 4G2]OAV43690.1 hypothetical protein A3850_003885 [Lewinella sp. 4G2]